MIRIDLTPENVRKLLIWGYVDVDQIRLTLPDKSASIIIDLTQELIKKQQRRNQLGVGV